MKKSLSFSCLTFLFNASDQLALRLLKCQYQASEQKSTEPMILLKGKLINVSEKLHLEDVYRTSVSLTFRNVYPATSVLLSVPSATSQTSSELGRSSGSPQLTLHRRGSYLRLVQHFRARAFVSLHHILLHQHHLVCSSLKTWYCSPCSFKSLSLPLIAYSPSGVVMLAQQGAGEQNKLRPLN